MSEILRDDYGRKMRKLRVSLLDACNFRCTYCMPASATFAKAHDLLSPEEIATIVGNLTKLGIEEVRLTGGEPTLRAELIEIAERLSLLPLKSVGITTNGSQLKKNLADLKKTKIKNLNISLDSLKPQRFKAIARFDGLEEVKSAIETAAQMGFTVKINTVLMRQNFDEIESLLMFAHEIGVEIRFLELMKIGVALNFFDDEFVSAGEAIHWMRKAYKLKQLPVPADSTAFKYQLENGTQVGFIASETVPFCASCSRLRLDSKGALRACLMKEEQTLLRGVPFENYPAIISEVLGQKPYVRVEKVEQSMYQIGG